MSPAEETNVVELFPARQTNDVELFHIKLGGLDIQIATVETVSACCHFQPYACSNNKFISPNDTVVAWFLKEMNNCKQKYDMLTQTKTFHNRAHHLLTLTPDQSSNASVIAGNIRTHKLIKSISQFSPTVSQLCRQKYDQVQDKHGHKGQLKHIEWRAAAQITADVNILRT